MNICFYTSDNPSAANQLNINHLVQNRPDHNYSFLNIRSTPEPQKTMMDKLRRKYSELKYNDGRFDFERDLIELKTRLATHIATIDKKNFRQGYAGAVNDELSIQFLTEVQPDIIIQCGAGIMKPCTFGLAKQGTINLHHGIMPEVRGIESTFWCLFYGIKDKIGVSCHFIDENLDTGAVIAQSYLNTKATSFTDIQTENYLMGRDVLVKSIDILNKGGYTIKSLGEIPSCYFGNVNPFLYYALKKRNFAPLMKISDKAFRMKEKKYLEF